jgi:hypothetical protein
MQFTVTGLSKHDSWHTSVTRVSRQLDAEQPNLPLGRDMVGAVLDLDASLRRTFGIGAIGTYGMRVTTRRETESSSS